MDHLRITLIKLRRFLVPKLLLTLKTTNKYIIIVLSTDTTLFIFNFYLNIYIFFGGGGK